MALGIRLSVDEDLLRLEPSLNESFPRLDREGGFIRDWGVQHGLAVEEIDRRFRVRKDVSEQFEIGRLGLRTQEQLRTCAAAFALHYIFLAADTQGDPTGYFARKAAHYYKRAGEVFEAVAILVDYDFDGDGTIDADGLNQPFSRVFVRG